MNFFLDITMDAIEALLLFGIFEALYDKKKFIIRHKIKSAVFFILFILITNWSTFHISKIYHSFFSSIFITLLLCYITKIRLFDAFTIFCVFIVILGVTEYLVQTLGIFIFNINVAKIYAANKYFYMFILFSKVLQIISVILLFKYNLYFKKLKLFEHEGTIFSNIIVQGGIFSLFIISINSGFLNIRNTKLYNIFIFAVYFIFLIAEFKELKKYKKVVIIESNYKVKKQQIKNMNEIIKIIRQEKLDFVTHIDSIHKLCSLNKPDASKKIKEYVSGISDTIHSSFKFFNTGNDYIDGLLSIKNNYAVKNNIDFRVIIEEPFSSINIKENELISIISNLVDNAFEAFQTKSNIQDKQISIDTYIEETNFFIEVTDNGDMVPENIQNKIFDRGFSTKLKKSSDHGFGLYITKKLVEQNNGKILLNTNPDYTTFLIQFNIR